MEILKQKLEIVAQHNLTPVNVQVLASSAISDAEEIADFIHSGQLMLEDSDASSSETTSERGKPKRKRKPKGK